MKYMPLLLVCLLLVGSCRTAKPVRAEAPSVQTETPTLVFVVMRIATDTLLHRNTVDLLRVTKTSGKLKPEAPTSSFENSLTLEVYEGTTLISTHTIAHPLYKQVEYADGTTLISKNVVLLQEDFFVRLQLNEKPHRLDVYETLKNQPKTLLKTIPL